MQKNVVGARDVAVCRGVLNAFMRTLSAECSALSHVVNKFEGKTRAVSYIIHRLCVK